MESEIKNAMELFTHTNSLPKIDLHCHLFGSIRKQTLLDLLPDKDKVKLDDYYKKMDYANAFNFFAITNQIANDLTNVKRITKEVIEDWNKHNTIYLEIRTTLKKTDKYSMTDYLNAVLTEIDYGNNNYNMITRLIISLNRSRDLTEYEEVINVYKNYNNADLKKLIVGIDYCGYENNDSHSYKEMLPIFNELRIMGLKITIHMGECPNYQSFPFNEFIPDRVSHCYFFNDNDYNEVMKRNIPIEVCPTSSYITTKAIIYSEIPMKNFYNKTVKNMNQEDMVYKRVCFCTDDTMLFLSDISQEYFEVAEAFKISIKELKEIVYNSIDFIFESNEEIRNKLRNKLEHYYI